MPTPEPPADGPGPYPTTHQYLAFHGWSGRWEEVARRLFATPGDLVAAPCCALLLAGPHRGDVVVLERDAPGGPRARTLARTGAVPEELPGRLARLVLDGAPAEETVAALTAAGGFTDLGTTPAPPTARGAFGHPLRHYPEDGRLDAYVLAARRDGERYVPAGFGRGPAREPGWELFTVTGLRRAVAGALYGLPREIVGREHRLLFLRAGETCEIHHFVTAPGDPAQVTVRVHRGTGPDDTAARALAAARGAETPGERTRAVAAVLDGLGDWEVAGPSLAPISPRGLFGRPLDALAAGRPTAADVVGAAVLVH
ncbi:hypothetical protein AB0G74_32180 [Streptomyces sp. NPDC020875]|uniref:hypothetical protein n=1 Tax=Streptomyces sp. NPDC020875 TaxID=3154898 RepID=UPI0033FA28CB